MKIDFHVHTRSSPDSLIRPADLARKSARLGIIPTIADHDSIRSHAAMRALHAPFIPAEEIFTDKGDLIGLFVNELIPKGTLFLEAIDRIHEQGGVAYLPHMFDRKRSGRYASDSEAAMVDVIEVFNARCMDPSFNRLADEFARSRKLLRAAGTDSHFLFEFGSTYTDLPGIGLDDLDSPKAIIKALGSKKASIHGERAPLYARGTTKVVSLIRRKILGHKP
jgi:predicted metal-dependent phosphoesterase TrpH